jgi:hypothetical protein
LLVADKFASTTLEITDLAWLPDATAILVGGDVWSADGEDLLPSEIRAVDVSSGSERLIVTASDDGISGLTIARSGQSFAYTSYKLDPDPDEYGIESYTLHVASLEGGELASYPKPESTQADAQEADQWAIYLE